MACIPRFPAIAISLFIALAAGPAAALEGALKRIADRQQVNVGYSEDAPPFSFKDAKGQPVGYSLDLCMEIVARLKQEIGQPQLRVKLLPVPPDQLPRLVGSGGVDLMCAGVSDTPGRRKTMAFSTPIFLSSVKLMVPAQGGARAATDLKGQAVAVLGRTTAEAAVQQFSKDRGLSLRLSRVVSPDAALSQLRLGQAGAWARDEILHLGTLAREADRAKFTLLGESLSTEVIAIALPRDAGLQRVVDQGLALAVRGGKVDAAYNRWFVQPHAGAPGGLKLALSPALKAEFDRLR